MKVENKNKSKRKKASKGKGDSLQGNSSKKASRKKSKNKSSQEKTKIKFDRDSIKRRSKGNKNKSKTAIEGIIDITSKGFAFVRVEDREKDIYIHKNNINGAMNGDTVEIILTYDFAHRNGARDEGIVVNVVDRAKTEMVGIYESNKGFGFVVPKNERDRDIFISRSFSSGAKTGDVVVVKITKYPDGKNKAEGKITEILAKADEKDKDIKLLIREKGLKETFPSSALAEANFVCKGKVDGVGRIDLREKLIFTIDGSDSKDFDDAVSLEQNKAGNYVLGVHIADVANYVQENSALDREAFKRGNSVYLLDRVIPMLPKNLSNGLCSLNPYEDRLTLSIDMEIDNNLKVISHKIYESIINSKFRLTYDKVSDFVENGVMSDEKVVEGESPYNTWSDELKNILIKMNNLASELAESRKNEGSIDFDLDEANFTLNEEGIPIEVSIEERRSANKLIEQFMLLANKTIAEHFFKLQTPFLYRCHPKPDEEKMSELKLFLKTLGLSFPGSIDNVHPKMICKILDEVKGTTYEHVVSTVTLRSMQKAIYDTVCDGHFGLAYRYYCHFTSPIRRYPDLMIHRIIKEQINKRDVKHFGRKVEAAAKNSSITERLAIELEREVEKMKKAEYMSYHIGEKHHGIISGVKPYGFYVELENTVEGLVREGDIGGDYYYYDEEKKALIGENKGNIFRLGDKVKIIVEDVDIDKGQIDFKLDK